MLHEQIRLFRLYVITNDGGFHRFAVRLQSGSEMVKSESIHVFLSRATRLQLTGPLVPSNSQLRRWKSQQQDSFSYLVIASHRAWNRVNIMLLVPFVGNKPPPLRPQHQQRQSVQWSSDGWWWWCWEPRPPPRAATMSSLVPSSAGLRSPAVPQLATSWPPAQTPTRPLIEFSVDCGLYWRLQEKSEERGKPTHHTTPSLRGEAAFRKRRITLQNNPLNRRGFCTTACRINLWPTVTVVLTPGSAEQHWLNVPDPFCFLLQVKKLHNHHVIIQAHFWSSIVARAGAADQKRTKAMQKLE